MKIWLLRSSEPMPIVNPEMRLLRMGMIAEALTKRGHEVIWFSNTFDHFTKKQMYNEDKIISVKENYKLYVLHGIRYKKNISISRIINHKMIAKKFSKYSKKMEKPDLIYVSIPTIDYAYEAVKYGKKNNVPVIIDVRDLWPDTFYHILPKALLIIGRPYIKYLDYKLKKILKSAFAINSISDDMLNWELKKANRQKSKFDRYFYIGYDITEEENDKNTRKNVIDKNKFNISFFATINNQFDYQRIAQMAEQLYKKDKDIVINICGDGPKLDTLEKLVKNMPNVKLFGWTDKDNLKLILENSKIGLAPYNNTFDFNMSVSNKFAEYISYGLPVVIYSGGYMKKLVQKNKCGISTQDINKVCNYIIKLKNNKEEYLKESKNAKKLYNSEFIASEIYEDLANYLEQVKEEMTK